MTNAFYLKVCQKTNKYRNVIVTITYQSPTNLLTLSVLHICGNKSQSRAHPKELYWTNESPYNATLRGWT